MMSACPISRLHNLIPGFFAFMVTGLQNGAQILNYANEVRITFPLVSTGRSSLNR